MNAHSLSAEGVPRIRLKACVTFFAASDSFDRASFLLSDGAFKLFAHLCLRADRRTGRYETSLKQLASSLKKSRRIIGRHAAEMHAKNVCQVHLGSNQFARTVFEICDEYWPYFRIGDASLTHRVPAERAENPQPDGPSPATVTAVVARGMSDLDEVQYVKAVRETFLAVGCFRGIFRPTDKALARSFFERGIPLTEVTDAMILGAVRKYISWLNGNTSEKISSLKYFETVVDEVMATPLPLDYSVYLREKLRNLRKQWLDRSVPSAKA